MKKSPWQIIESKILKKVPPEDHDRLLWDLTGFMSIIFVVFMLAAADRLGIC